MFLRQVLSLNVKLTRWLCRLASCGWVLRTPSGERVRGCSQGHRLWESGKSKKAMGELSIPFSQHLDWFLKLSSCSQQTKGISYYCLPRARVTVKPFLVQLYHEDLSPVLKISLQAPVNEAISQALLLFCLFLYPSYTTVF